jgi:hypothetical protein
MVDPIPSSDSRRPSQARAMVPAQLFWVTTFWNCRVKRGSSPIRQRVEGTDGGSAGGNRDTSMRATASQATCSSA